MIKVKSQVYVEPNYFTLTSVSRGLRLIRGIIHQGMCSCNKTCILPDNIKAY